MGSAHGRMLMACYASRARRAASASSGYRLRSARPSRTTCIARSPKRATRQWAYYYDTSSGGWDSDGGGGGGGDF